VPYIKCLYAEHDVLEFQAAGKCHLERSRKRFMAVAGHKLESRDIVDGHRQKTLQLLWTLIFVFQVITIISATLGDVALPDRHRV